MFYDVDHTSFDLYLYMETLNLGNLPNFTRSLEPKLRSLILRITLHMEDLPSDQISAFESYGLSFRVSHMMTSGAILKNRNKGQGQVLA